MGTAAKTRVPTDDGHVMFGSMSAPRSVGVARRGPAASISFRTRRTAAAATAPGDVLPPQNVDWLDAAKKLCRAAPQDKRGKTVAPSNAAG